MKRKIISKTNGVTLYKTKLDIFIIEYGNDIRQTTSINRAVSMYVECIRDSLLKELLS